MATHGDFHQPEVPAGGAWLLNNHPDFLFSSSEKRLMVHLKLDFISNNDEHNAVDNSYRGVRLIITENFSSSLQIGKTD